MINQQQQKKENTLNQDDAAVAIYPTHKAAEAAVRELQQSGFDMKKLSIVGRDYHNEENVFGYYNTGDRMQAWGQIGAGSLVSWIVETLEGVILIGGLSVVGAGLYSFGIPKDSILRYERAIKNDKFVLIVHGSTDDTTHAQEILNHIQPEPLELFRFTQ